MGFHHWKYKKIMRFITKEQGVFILRRLKGHFSQVDYKIHQHGLDQTNVVTKFKSIIPSTATDVYYKDAIGNVTTSNLRYERKKAILELRPRYPLYGGWRTTWFHGYTLPQIPFLSPVQGSADKHILKMSITPTVKGLLLEKATLKVILPEDATDIKIKNPYSGVETQFLTFSYFDTTGRPTILLEYENVVDEFDKLVEVLKY